MDTITAKTMVKPTITTTLMMMMTSATDLVDSTTVSAIESHPVPMVTMTTTTTTTSASNDDDTNTTTTSSGGINPITTTLDLQPSNAQRHKLKKNTMKNEVSMGEETVGLLESSTDSECKVASCSTTKPSPQMSFNANESCCQVSQADCDHPPCQTSSASLVSSTTTAPVSSSPSSSSSSSSSSSESGTSGNQFRHLSHGSTSRKSTKTASGKRVYQRPPDGGWGWMVVFASFMINVVTDGISFSFGVLFVALNNEFQESKSKTAWIPSLFLSIPLIMGPIASAITDHYGCRKVTIVGAIISSGGFMLASYGTCIEHLILALSLSGFGLALCYVTSVVCVAYYFEKRRSLATGLSVCGAGLGTFITAPLLNYLIEIYEWRDTFRIISGILLSMIFYGCLFREIEIDPSFSSDSDSSEDSTSDIESNLMDSETNSLASYEEDGVRNSATASPVRHSVDRRPHLLNGRNPIRVRHISECDPADCSFPQTSASLINIPTYIKDRRPNVEKATDQDQKDVFGELTFRRGGYLHTLISFYPHLLNMFLPWNELECNDLTVKTVANCNSNQTGGFASKSVNKVIQEKPLDEKPRTVEFGPTHFCLDSNHMNGVAVPVEEPTPVATVNRVSSAASRFGQLWNLRQNTKQEQHHSDMSGNTLHNLRLPRASLTYRSAMLIISKYRLKASSAPDIYRTSMATINETKGRALWHNMKELLLDMASVENFKSLRYTIFCLANFLLYMCLDVPYVYVPEMAIASGTANSGDSSLLISYIGVFNTIGVVLVGWIGDKPWIDPSDLYAVFVSVSGISLALIPFLTAEYRMIATLCAVYGFTIGANYSLVSPILVGLISLDSFTNAYGMLLLMQGAGSLVGPPVAGWIYDEWGSYDGAFYLTGICIVISALLVIPVGQSRKKFLFGNKRKSPESDCESTSSFASSCYQCFRGAANKPKGSLTISNS